MDKFSHHSGPQFPIHYTGAEFQLYLVVMKPCEYLDADRFRCRQTPPGVRVVAMGWGTFLAVEFRVPTVGGEGRGGAAVPLVAQCRFRLLSLISEYQASCWPLGQLQGSACVRAWSLQGWPHSCPPRSHPLPISLLSRLSHTPWP